MPPLPTDRQRGPAAGRRTRTRSAVGRRDLAASAAQHIWRLSLLRDAHAFRRSLRDAAATQSGVLARLLRRNQDSEFGRRFGFTTISGVDAYRSRVPLATYDDFADDIARIARGEPKVLTSEPVRLLEPTSGSTGAAKLIPYTASLKAEFQRALSPWLADTFAQHPSLLRGRAYWSVSPAVRRDEISDGGIPIGFEDDSEYLGRLGRKLMGAGLAVPMSLRLIDDMETFRYVSLLLLLRCRSLTLMSIWHPTFLLLLLQPLSRWIDLLSSDIATGQMTPPTPMPEHVRKRLELSFRPDPARASEVRRICSAAADGPLPTAALWPRLSLVSSWLDGNARSYLPNLKALFPGTPLQAKGLVSTEAIVSIPRHGAPGAAVALRSHFFEFLPEPHRSDGATVLAHELEHGRRYMAVITTGGGLYRYMTDDIVEVVGFIDSCPMLEFIGKRANVVDHFGEKLNERFVAGLLAAALSRHDMVPTFAMIAFEDAAEDPAYAVFVEDPSISDREARSVGQQLEQALLESFHYRYCRDLGQLGALRVFRIRDDAHAAFAGVCQRRGQRAGDIKAGALHNMPNWSRHFDGYFL